MNQIIVLLIACLISVNTNAQNVGIGTSTPVTTLDVNGQLNNPTIPSPTSTGILRIGYAYNGGIDIGITSTVPIAPWFQAGFGGVNAIPIIFQPLGGNVGIGTTNPLKPLEVKGDGGIQITNGANASTSNEIYFSDNGQIRSLDSFHRIVFNRINDQMEFNEFGRILFKTGNPLTEVMRITNDGNVGIGTLSPNTSAQLDVSSITKGFLPPRMTISQRNAIQNPVSGLVIYCSDCYELEMFDGNNWKNMNGNFACVSSTLPYIKICDQIWMPKNLDVSEYRNGDQIPQVTDSTQWHNLTTGAWCWYNNDSATYAATYGKLYNWFAVNDSRGLAPQGWHVPSVAEWSTLSTCLGGDDVAGGKMKEAGTIHWQNDNTAADNSSGFTGLPSGYRGSNGIDYNIGNSWNCWSSTENSANNLAWSRYLNYNSSNLYSGNSNKLIGFSVRCLRD